MKRKIAASLLVMLMILSTSCAGITINPNITGVALDLILEEAGYDLAYLGLKNTDTARLNRISEAISKAERMLGERDIMAVSAAVSTYISAMPEFKLDETYQFLVRRATRLLKKVVKIDVSLPEEVEKAEGYIRAFLEGGKDGVDDLILNRIA